MKNKNNPEANAEGSFSREHLHNELDKALDQMEADPKFVQGFTLRQWDSLIKNKEQEAEVHRLQGFKLDVLVDQVEPLWETVKRIESGPPVFNQERKPEKREWGKDIFVPDLHIGFLKQEHGKMLELHDERCIDLLLQRIEDTQPDSVILLGDVLDFANYSKHPQTPEMAQTTNASLERAHRLLKNIRELGGQAMKIVYLEGNHEKRLPDAIKRNMSEAYGVKRVGEKLPVLTVPYLLSLEQLGVEYHGAYPAGRYQVARDLIAVHGTVSNKGNTARKIMSHENTSVIQAHNHRWEASAKTIRHFKNAQQYMAYSAMCLCRIDGAVHSFYSGMENGQPAKMFEDWQQGWLERDYNRNDWFIRPVHIDLKHQTRVDNITYRPRSRRRAA